MTATDAKIHIIDTISTIEQALACLGPDSAASCLQCVSPLFSTCLSYSRENVGSGNLGRLFGECHSNLASCGFVLGPEVSICFAFSIFKQS